MSSSVYGRDECLFKEDCVVCLVRNVIPASAAHWLLAHCANDSLPGPYALGYFFLCQSPLLCTGL